MENAREETAKLSKAQIAQGENERSHSEVQAWLRDLGLQLGYDVWMAANDRGRLHEGRALGHNCLDHLPLPISTSTGADAIRLIDVLWLERDDGNVAAAFEVEHSTSIYSGIVRMLDLALSGSDFHAAAGPVSYTHLTLPTNREV